MQAFMQMTVDGMYLGGFGECVKALFNEIVDPSKKNSGTPCMACAKNYALYAGKGLNFVKVLFH